MHIKYNTRSPHNPLSPPQTSRFAIHPEAFGRSATGSHDSGHCDLNFPIHPDPGCRPFAFCLACPTPTCKGNLSPKQLHHEHCYLSNPSTPHRATA